MLDAFRPVVLAPAGAAGAGAGGAAAGATPLVRFSLVRSYANARSPGLASGATADGRGPRARMSLDGGSLDEGPADAGALYGGPSGRGGGAGGPRGGAGSAEAGGPAPEAGPGEIWSFRSATLDVGALDVQARPPAAPSVPPVVSPGKGLPQGSLLVTACGGVKSIYAGFCTAMATSHIQSC